MLKKLKVVKRRSAKKPAPKRVTKRPHNRVAEPEQLPPIVSEPATPLDEPEQDAARIVKPRPVSPPSSRLIVKRGGHSITRQIPRPIVLIDTREQMAFSFAQFPNWIAGEKRQKLPVGDYSIEGMQKLLIMERKSLSDLITTLMQNRSRFFEMCEKLSSYRWRTLLVEASYEDIKTWYDEDLNTSAHPNAVSGSLDALEAKFGVPVIYTSRYRPLAEEKAASWLSKHFTYWYLEKGGMGRVLQEGDL